MKRFFGVMFAVGIIMVLVACGGNKVDDSAAEEYIAQAKEVVHLLNEENYEEIHDLVMDELKSEITIDVMEGDISPVIDESGTYEEIDKASVEEEGGNYITVITTKYSDDDRIFTVTFNEDMELVGLFIK